MHIKFEPSVRSQREPLQPPTVSGHGLSSVSIESLVMGLVEAKKEAERADLPASSRRPGGRHVLVLPLAVRLRDSC